MSLMLCAGSHTKLQRHDTGHWPCIISDSATCAATDDTENSDHLASLSPGHTLTSPGPSDGSNRDSVETSFNCVLLFVHNYPLMSSLTHLVTLLEKEEILENRKLFCVQAVKFMFLTFFL